MDKAEERLLGLIPESTKPKRTRRMTTDYRMVEFIKSLREQYPIPQKESPKVVWVSK